MPTLIASLLRKAALLVLMLLALSLAVFYISRLTPAIPCNPITAMPCNP